MLNNIFSTSNPFTMPNQDDGSQPVAPAADTQPNAKPVESAPADTPSDAEKQAEASREAAKAGESRRKMAETLLSLAEKDPSARAQLSEMAKDPYERTYLERKFGEKFTSLVTPAEPAKTPVTNSPELAQKVDLLMQTHETERRESMKTVKTNLGLTLDQEGLFDDLVKTLEGQEIGGKKIGFREAVEMAARQISPSAPSASSLFRSDVTVRPEDTSREVNVKISSARIQENARYTGAKTLDDFKPIAEGIAKTGTYTLPVKTDL